MEDGMTYNQQVVVDNNYSTQVDNSDDMYVMPCGSCHKVVRFEVIDRHTYLESWTEFRCPNCGYTD